MKHKFIVDYMCGRLARWLRILGFDTKYVSKNSKIKILLQSLQEQRIVLTRNTKLSPKKSFKLILIKYDNIFDQIKQLATELKLEFEPENFFSRCCLCNEKLIKLDDKKSIQTQVPPYVYETQETFFVCKNCNKIYWRGSHHDLFMQNFNNIKK